MCCQSQESFPTIRATPALRIPRNGSVCAVLSQHLLVREHVEGKSAVLINLDRWGNQRIWRVVNSPSITFTERTLVSEMSLTSNFHRTNIPKLSSLDAPTKAEASSAHPPR